ncbi:MAG: c-type cytochrome biogenesis protein CcmI [Gammaproteobacteria bacterium]
MIIFWLIAGAMLLVALLYLAVSLLSRKDSIEVDRNEQNLLIAEERLQVVEAEYADSLISENEYHQLKAEIEKTLADELVQSAGKNRSRANAGAIGLAAVGIMLPLFGLAMYGLLGNPDFIQSGSNESRQAVAQHSPAAGAGTEGQSMDTLVDQLARKLQENPDNLEGWFLLGKSLMNLGRYGEAVKAFEIVSEKLPEPQSGVLLALANAVAMNQNGRIGGRPAELVQQALELDPQSVTGLWLAGMAAEEAGEHEQALAYWQKADPLLADDVQNRAELRNMMRAVAGKLGRTLVFDEAPAMQPEAAVVPKAAPAPGAAKSVRVKVSLSPEAQAQVSPDDTVFIFAKAVEGPPMPLAASRHQVKDLPVEVTLDDAMAMMPQMKMSAFDEVNVSAKVSSSGNAAVSEGDRNSSVVTVAFPAGDVVELIIQ